MLLFIYLFIYLLETVIWVLFTFCLGCLSQSVTCCLLLQVVSNDRHVKLNVRISVSETACIASSCPLAVQDLLFKNFSNISLKLKQSKSR